MSNWSSEMLHFLEIEDKTLHSKKVMTCFIARVALLWWSERDPQYPYGLPAQGLARHSSCDLAQFS